MGEGAERAEKMTPEGCDGEERRRVNRVLEAIWSGGSRSPSGQVPWEGPHGEAARVSYIVM